MWPVTDRFLNALGRAHLTVTRATFTAPGELPVPLRIKAGTVSVDAGANYRRTGSAQLFGTKADYERLTAPGGILHIDHGIRYGNESELVPVFHGEVIAGSQQMGNGSISCRFADLNKVLERTDFLAPYSPSSGTPRVQVITNVVQGAVPGATVVNASTDSGTVQGAVWEQHRLDVLGDLTKDGGTEAFWRPNGTFLIRDRLTLTSPSVWTIAPGAGGTLKPGIERARPMDRLYNTVIVRPSATDGSQTWVQQIVQVTDPTHPRHPSKVGVVPYIWNSPTILTAASALNAGDTILARVLGTTETLDFGMVSNPALEAGDPVRIITPALGMEDASIFRHFLDSFSLDLVTGGMTANTRSQVADV